MWPIPLQFDMDQMAEEIVAHEAALNKSLDITKEKNAEIRDTSKKVTKFEADLETLVEKLTECETTLEEMDKEYKERDEEVCSINA